MPPPTRCISTDGCGTCGSISRQDSTARPKNSLRDVDLHTQLSQSLKEISSNFFGTRSFQCARESGSFSDCFFPLRGRLKSGDTMTRGRRSSWRILPSNSHQFRCSPWCWHFPFVKSSRVGLCFEKVGVSMAKPSFPQWYHIHLPPLRPPCRNVVSVVVARGSLVNLVNSAACRLVVCLKKIS